MAERFNWPDGRRVAVSLTFDDGLQSQLNIAIPILDKFGFKATFYINPRGDDYRSLLKPWKDVADRGHEIGNHTLTHPCSCNFQFARTAVKCLEKMTLEDIRADIMEAHRRIREVIPNGSKTFAYPCYETTVGRGLSKRSYIPVVAEVFLAARGWGELGYPNSPLTCDLHELWSWPAHRMSFEEMIGLTVRASYEGGWAIYTFHGVNEGHLPVSDYDLTGFLKFLKDNNDKIWVAPVCEVAEYIVEVHSKLGLCL
jgi:peptidoglycan/xylan/chitin deacetylase (PgdA/CDA1 family)